MARKTIEVSTVVDICNRAIAYTHKNGTGTAEERKGFCFVAEQVLHETGNYKGFRYLDGHEAVLRGEYDDTARHYH